MTIAEGMIAEFNQESKSTRKMLERLPEDKFAWKPHDKSMSLGRLATHVAEIPDWVETIVNDETLDMDASEFKPKALESKQEILDYFDENVAKFEKVLQGKQDEHLFKNWKLIAGGQTAVDMPRVACLRGFVLSHLIHHRGQLSVYLRENDVPLPAIYGPSADEGF